MHSNCHHSTSVILQRWRQHSATIALAAMPTRIRRRVADSTIVVVWYSNSRRRKIIIMALSSKSRLKMMYVLILFAEIVWNWMRRLYSKIICDWSWSSMLVSISFTWLIEPVLEIHPNSRHHFDVVSHWQHVHQLRRYVILFFDSSKLFDLQLKMLRRAASTESAEISNRDGNSGKTSSPQVRSLDIYYRFDCLFFIESNE